MACKFIVSTVSLFGDGSDIKLNDIYPTSFIYDEQDLNKAIAYAKFDADKEKPNYKIEVETVFEEHMAYKTCAEKFKANGKPFGNIPYAKYIVRTECVFDDHVRKSVHISLITFHNII